MLNAAMEPKTTDGLNLRLSIACNSAVPFMLFGMILGQVSADLLAATLWVVAGLFGYTLGEYIFHRFILHHIVTRDHILHHQEPFAPHALPFSTGLSAHTMMLVALSLCLGLDLALCITLGSSIGYAIYGQLHELIHRDPSLARRLTPRLYRHHMLHHRNTPGGDEHNFGVLTTFWDRFFGTFAA
jgi:sterol desaturase/sphingolipid hydroxylase (fatty acid hydroxylase superfamily)